MWSAGRPRCCPARTCAQPARPPLKLNIGSRTALGPLAGSRAYRGAVHHTRCAAARRGRVIGGSLQTLITPLSLLPSFPPRRHFPLTLSSSPFLSLPPPLPAHQRDSRLAATTAVRSCTSSVASPSASSRSPPPRPVHGGGGRPDRDGTGGAKAGQIETARGGAEAEAGRREHTEAASGAEEPRHGWQILEAGPCVDLAAAD